MGELRHADGAGGVSLAEAVEDVAMTRMAGANPMLRGALDGQLVWLPEAGMGYFECEFGATPPYDADYFRRYQKQADTCIGRALVRHRAELVKRWCDLALSYGPERPLLDVGIGAGTFLEALWSEGVYAAGFDVNPAGVEWLKGRGAYRNLYGPEPFDVVTFWDALEHIRDPRPALAACARWAFVAIPIFRDAEHVLASRHYRKDEHYWYFTRAGFRRFAEAQGFEVVDIVATETALGRDDIETFVLCRRA